MDVVKSWLVGVTIAAVIAAVAEYVTPEGAIKKIGKLAGGLLLLVAILQPIVSLDYEGMSGILSNYRVNSEEYAKALEEENLSLIKIIIEEETAAYIQDKAKEFGISCTARVNCKINDDNTPYPASVEVVGVLSQTQITLLTQLIETDLAIKAEDQQYERINGDG